MKIVGSGWLALLFGIGILTAHAAPENPYASIVARNVFGLVPIPVVDPASLAAPADPPPKITPNGIMTIFGKLQALFKVANKGKPGQPAKEDSYVLAEGERQDNIEVVKIDQESRTITFNNHGAVQALPLVAASNGSAPGAAVGGAVAGFNPGMAPRPGVMPPGGRPAFRGHPAEETVNPGYSGVQQNSGVENNGAQNFGGNNYQSPNGQQPNNIEDQVMNAAKEMAIIEQNRIATQEAVDKGLMPPLPPTMLTPPNATAADGSPLIAPTPNVPLPPAPGH